MEPSLESKNQPAAQKQEPAKPESESIRELRDISLAIDTYDDIFSDFDPRPYSLRALSDDFLKEIKKRGLEGKKGKLEIWFFLPEEKRDAKVEPLIRKRLREYFSKHFAESNTELDTVKKRGIGFLIIGIALIAVATFLASYYETTGALSRVLVELTLIGGWFCMFTGMETLFNLPADLVEKKKLHEHMSKADFIFFSEEEPASKKPPAEPSKV